MRSESELREELNWFKDWPEAEDIDAPCETAFDSTAYFDGIKYALGEDEGRVQLPPIEAVNTVITRIQDEFPDATVRVERGGFPPQSVWIQVMTIIDIESVDDYQRISDTISTHAREVEDEYELEEMIYTSLDVP